MTKISKDKSNGKETTPSNDSVKSPIIKKKIRANKKKKSKKNKLSTISSEPREVNNINVDWPTDPTSIAARKKAKLEKRSQRQPKGKEDIKAVEAKNYLNTWTNDRENWKYRKNIQRFLMIYSLNVDRVDNSCFKMILKYFENSEGNARKYLIDSAQKTLEENQEIASDVTEQDATKLILKKRAKRILKLIK